MKSLATLAAIGVCSAAASAQISSINSLISDTRNFNDFPSSNLVTNANFGAGTLSVVENNFGAPGSGSFANRHRFLFSNNGTTPYLLQNNEGFELSFDINIKGGNRRLIEAGFYSDTFVGGEPRMIAKHNDAAFAFDAWVPFTFMGSYGNDQTTNLRLLYTPGSGSGGTQTAPATLTFWRDGTQFGPVVAGNFNGPDFLNGYANNSIFGFYVQNSPNLASGAADPAAFSDVQISNIRLVPTPGAAGLMALAGLAAARRRR